MGNVKVQFPRQARAPTDIATAAFNTSPYTLWTPPIDRSRITSKTQDPIEQVINSEVVDDSDGFEIEGSIRIDSPDIDAPTRFVGDPSRSNGRRRALSVMSRSNIPVTFTNESATVVEAPTYANSAHNVPCGL